jgi:hypothetical protein
MSSIQYNNSFTGLDNSSKRISIYNNLFKLQLKNHQLALLYRVLEIDNNNSNNSMPYGVMSDKPGAGKTYVAIAMIYFSKKFFNSKGVTIIVVPHNLYSQWVNSINELVGKKLTYKCLVEYGDITALYSNTEILYKNDIIITTPLYYDSLATTINSLSENQIVRRIFFDEADTMKNLLVHTIKTSMTWFISASINTVFDTKTLKAKIGIYDLYLPKLLENACFCKPEFIDANIKLLKPKVEIFNAKDFYIDNILAHLLTQDEIKYINAHDYTKIREECGNNIIKSTKDIVKHMYINYKKNIDANNDLLKSYIKQLKFCNKEDKDILEENKAKIENIVKEYTNKYILLNLLIKENYLCINCFENDLLTNNNLNSNADNNQYIDMFLTECNDYLCKKCAIVCNSQLKCINCNAIYNTDVYENNRIALKDSYITTILNRHIDKLVLLEKIIEISENKIILYTQYRGLSNFLKKILDTRNIKSTELTGGNIKELDKILHDFKNNKKIKIILIDDACLGVGLNMEYVSNIIFFHNVNQDIEKQLIGRAQRFGRTNRLAIWKIFYNNES